MVGSTSVPFRVLVALLYAFLLAPILIVVPLSFSNDTYLSFPPESWGVRWYVDLAHNQPMIDAFFVSLGIALVVMVLSLVIGIPSAYAITRHAFRGSEALLSLFTAPLLLPSIVLGLAMLLVFVDFRLLATWQGLVIAHLIVATPYVIRIISTALLTLPPSVEEAASTLGARPLTVFRRVTLPLMMPGLVASAALSFLVSFDEVVISLFITGPNITTLPVALFQYADNRTDPLIAAVSVILVLGTLLIVAVVEKSVGLSRAVGK